MVKLKLFDAKAYSVNLKCTIQNQGRLGFTDDTAEALGLKSGEVKAIAIAEDETTPGDLYMIIGDGLGDEAFRVMRAGDYYYLPTRNLFSTMGLDYQNQTIMFDMVRSQENDFDNLRVYRMNKRVLPRKAASDKPQKGGRE